LRDAKGDERSQASGFSGGKTGESVIKRKFPLKGGSETTTTDRKKKERKQKRNSLTGKRSSSRAEDGETNLFSKVATRCNLGHLRAPEIHSKNNSEKSEIGKLKLECCLPSGESTGNERKRPGTGRRNGERRLKEETL